MTKKLEVEHTVDYGYCVNERFYDKDSRLVGIHTHFITEADSKDAIWYCNQVKDLIERIRRECE